MIAEILECEQVDQGISKTRILYEVQLSFAQMKEYLKYLQQCDLLSFDKENRLYRSTDKGKEFLRLHDEMTKLTSGHRGGKSID